jgi:hypothetical protein
MSIYHNITLEITVEKLAIFLIIFIMQHMAYARFCKCENHKHHQIKCENYKHDGVYNFITNQNSFNLE